MITLRDGSKTADVKLDRIVQFDERSRQYPVRSIATAPPPRERIWRLDRRRQGDQGDEGECVQYGITHAVLAAPDPISIAVARKIWGGKLIYWPAQQEDPWPGGSYPGASPVYEGTSVLAGLTVGQRLALYTNYYWSFNMDEFVMGLLNVGPGVGGLWWKEGMAKPGPGGLIEATGKKLGGHCISFIGLDYGRRFPDGRVFDVAVIAQSWGLGHGDRGRVYIPLDQLAELFADDGECAFVTGRTKIQRI